jgi:protein tyrosine phosphatase
MYAIEDLRLENYKIDFKEKAKSILNGDLSGIKNGKMFFSLKGDFNSNKKEDLAIIYKDPTTNRYVYLVIFEKTNNKYKYIQHFELNYYKAFLVDIASATKDIHVYFQNDTDWMIKIFWNGKNYKIREPDPYGP